jgi:fructose 5-dehydrogenase small subunit
MNNFCRDDAPATFSLGRRSLLVGVVLLAGGHVLTPDALSEPAATLPLAKFMQISNLLIAHQLNTEVGARIAPALTTLDPSIEQDIDQLIAIATAKNAKIVEDFFPDVPEGRLKDTALKIIFAWYTGVATDTYGAEVFAYELALMYQPTKDVMTIPSYAISGPNGWNSSSPPLTDMPTF